MAKKRYSKEIEEGISLNELYLNKACFLPEFSKIVAITYLTVDSDGKKELKKIDGSNEIELLYQFCMLLDDRFNSYVNNRNAFTLAGHNIIGHDIPLLIKRIIKHKDVLGQERSSVVPMVLKNYIKAKPWDSNVIDTMNMWKFNGTDYISLELISKYLGFKYKTQLLSKEDLNHLYWDFIEDEPETTMTKMNRQSGTFTNLAYQLVDTLRKL